MADSSAKESAPNRLNKPATAHTESAAPSLPIERVISAGTIKIPVPIMMPMTMAVASHAPSARSNCGGEEAAGAFIGLGSIGFMDGLQPLQSISDLSTESTLNVQSKTCHGRRGRARARGDAHATKTSCPHCKGESTRKGMK